MFQVSVIIFLDPKDSFTYLTVLFREQCDELGLADLMFVRVGQYPSTFWIFGLVPETPNQMS